MIHDPALLERLSGLPSEPAETEVFRATRQNLDPLAPSTRGGRWAPVNQFQVLYTSLERDGALAELAFHWGLLSPLPTKPAHLHRIRLTASKALRLNREQLAALGVVSGRYESLRYEQTQRIGAAAWFLECDALIVPSARWNCDNLVLFSDRHAPHETLECVQTESVEWISWAIGHGFLDANTPEVAAALASQGQEN